MTELPSVRLLHPTDIQTMADYSADCRDRLLAAGLPPTLHAAGTCAGRQIEGFKPLVMGWHPDGRPLAALAASLPRRTVLVVLADGKRVAVQPIPLTAMFDGARKNMPALVGSFSSHWIPGILGTVLDEFGHTPTLALPRGSHGLLNAIGVLLAAPEAQTLTPALDQLIAQDICPVLVGLLGPATSGRPGKFSAVWPLLLPLAPYIDALVEG
jgi:hypothetical protein